MATLLELVNQFIGDVLAGNIYTNLRPFTDASVTPLRSIDGLANPHDHSNVIPGPGSVPPVKMHSPPPQTRNEIYQFGVDKLNIPQQVVTSQQKDVLLTREQIYAPNLPPPPTPDAGQENITNDPKFAKMQSFDPTIRSEKYFQDFANSPSPPAGNTLSNAKQLISNIGGTPISKPTAGDILASVGQSPLNPEAHKDIVKADPSFRKGQSFDPVRRSDIYRITDRDQQIRSNIGGTPDSVETLGDLKAKQGLPPSPSLKFRGPRSGDVPSESSLFAKPLIQPSRNDVYKDFDSAGNALRPDGKPPVMALDQITSKTARSDFASVQGQIGKDFASAHRLGNLYDDGDISIGARGGRYGLFTSPVPSELRTFDVVAVAHWLRNIGREFGALPIQDNNFENKVHRPAEMISKGVTFLASQFLLASLNPGGISPLGTTEKGPTNMSPLNAVYNPLAIPTAALPILRGTDVTGITIGALTTDYKTSLLARIPLQADVLSLKGETSSMPDLPGFQTPETGIDALDAALVSGVGPLDAAFSPLDEEKGFVEKEFSDHGIYMPFMFQDLRDTPEKFLYFRAFLKDGLTETFTPDWQVDRYYGRVDQIPVYKGTIRTINVAFDVVAWDPKDLPVIYRKLDKLQSMVYPLYDTKGFLKTGPIVRMRIGDLFATGNKKGIPGYITFLDFAYDDGIWNIQENFKVPRKISVSLSYTIIHDGNPGIYPFSGQLLSDDTENTTGPTTFGAAKFVTQAESRDTTISVSKAEIRKIFDQVKNKTGI